MYCIMAHVDSLNTPIQQLQFQESITYCYGVSVVNEDLTIFTLSKGIQPTMDLSLVFKGVCEH